MSEVVEGLCSESDVGIALLRGKTAEELRGAIHHMLNAWRFSPADLEDALRRAAQCRHWRAAQTAWDEYEALNARTKTLDPTDPMECGEWLRLVKAKTVAFIRYQRHDDAANKLWRAGERSKVNGERGHDASQD